MGKYVVSQDIGLILSGTGLPARFFESLGVNRGYDGLLFEIRNDLKAILTSVFPDLDYLSEEKLAFGINGKLDQLRKQGYSVVSLDRVYTTPGMKADDGQYWLDVTRLYDDNGKSTPRGRLNGKYEHLAPEEMIQSIAADLKRRGVTEIAICDDVLFSGGSIIKVAEEFEKHGIQVTQAVIGVAIGDGVKKLAERGISVDTVFKYDNVVDQICERDFLVGIPQSGVLMQENGSLVKRPYLLPFGDPVKRASVPSTLAPAISYELSMVSVKLWEGLEKLAGRPIFGHELPEPVAMIGPSKRIADSIRECAARLSDQADISPAPIRDGRPNAYTINN